MEGGWLSTEEGKKRGMEGSMQRDGEREAGKGGKKGWRKRGGTGRREESRKGRCPERQ